jgi:hypothetical protein
MELSIGIILISLLVIILFIAFGPVIFRKIGEWIAVGFATAISKGILALNQKHKGEANEEKDKEVREQSSREQ